MCNFYLEFLYWGLGFMFFLVGINETPIIK